MVAEASASPIVHTAEESRSSANSEDPISLREGVVLPKNLTPAGSQDGVDKVETRDHGRNEYEAVRSALISEDTLFEGGATGDTDSKPEEVEPKKPLPPRTRIGRSQKDSEGNSKHVDEADWDPPDDPSRDGQFAVTVEKKLANTWNDSFWMHNLSLISLPLKKLFRSVVEYPGISLVGNHITIAEPYAPLFFHFDELRKEAEKSTEQDIRDDFKILAEFYQKWVLTEHDQIKALIDQGAIQYSWLWALYKPGDLLYSLDESAEPCFHKVITTDYRPADHYNVNDYSIRKFPRLCVDMWSISWDSSTNTFQRFTTCRSIRSFNGTCSITSLPFYPLKHYKNGNEVEIEKLLKHVECRGHCWKTLVSERPSCHLYSGPAKKAPDPNGTARQDAEMGAANASSVHLDERVVVDGTIALVAKSGILPPTHGVMGGRSQNRNIEYEVPISGGINVGYADFDDFPADKGFCSLQAQLSPATVHCFAIKTLAWFYITVSRIKPIDWARAAFHHLVLEDSTKAMLLGLVEQHRKNRDQVLSDVIPSKGKGLVIVLHGAPGVGKTLTAETIAEFTQKPLYPINIGELTADDGIVPRLQEIFTTAARWDAVLLLDEADVLLEKRSYEDLRRNGVVSVFLRMVEYYEGILFLTTNRIETMDIAFQSRIHIAVKYKELNATVRRQIWQKLIERIDDGEAKGKRELMEALDDLQEWELNGRQIRNVLTIAESLALSTGRRRGALRYHHVETIANQTLDFQHFFEDTSKERKGQVGDINKREFQERRMNRTFR